MFLFDIFPIAVGAMLFGILAFAGQIALRQ